jgi:hypothetical protein
MCDNQDQFKMSDDETFQDDRLGNDVSRLIQDYVDANPDKLMIDLRAGCTNTGIVFNSQIFDELIRAIFNRISIQSVEYQGKKYYETGSSWGGSLGEGDPPERPDYDPDVECAGYIEYGDVSEHLKELYSQESPQFPFIEVENPKDIIYHFQNIDIPLLNGVDVICDIDEVDHNFKLLDEIENYSPENIVLTGGGSLEKIVIENMSGVNDDHRGSNHCRLEVPYEREVELTLPVKLTDFIEALFRIKSHKWDFWYELYCDVSIEHEYLSDTMTLQITFDHGS